MRLFLLLPLFTLLVSSNLYPQDAVFNKESLWHTSMSQHYDDSKELSSQEASAIIKSPIYMELEKSKEEYQLKHFEITTGLKLTQLKQNTNDAVAIGKSNVFPTIQMKGTLWPLRWLGFDVNLDKSILVMLGSKQDPNIQNAALMSPYWLDVGVRLRYLFGKRDGSSFMAFKMGFHQSAFPVVTYPQYISKSFAKGIMIGAQRKLAFNQYVGVDMNFDFLLLSKLLDQSVVSNAQKGIGYRFSADIYATLVDNTTGLSTYMSFGYGQTSYISNLVGDGVSGDSRSLLNANHFEQTYSDLHLTFTARI